MTDKLGTYPLDLDDRTDWDEVRELVETSYRLTAGVRRVRRLDESGQTWM